MPYIFELTITLLVLSGFERIDSEKHQPLNVTLQTIKDQLTFLYHRVRNLDNNMTAVKLEPCSTPQLHPKIHIFKDCNEIYNTGQTNSGVYMITIFHGFYQIPIFCDMQTIGFFSGKRGWMTIQRRFSGEVNFDRGWDDYMHGFGFPDEEHWIGLRNIFGITRQKHIGEFDVRNPVLRVDLEDWDGVTAYMEHSSFGLLSEQYDFEIGDMGKYKGTNGLDGPLEFSSSSPFSTYDHNKDSLRNEDCIKSQRGGWWFGYCSHINLNGVYSEKREKMRKDRIFIRNWEAVNSQQTALRYISIKLQ